LKNKGVLADTCAWIDYFRPGRSGLGRVLDQALSNEKVFVCGMVLYELTQGIKSEPEKTQVMSALDALPYLEANKGLWKKAGELSSTLRKQGKTVPFSDTLIATLALENNLSLLTRDEHFKLIPHLTLHSTR
jgi:predicted nucleic acid-binding protein